jgi:hypothetical protein
MKHVIYYLPTGELTVTATLDDNIDPTGLNGDLWMEVPYPVSGNDYWINDGVLTEYSEVAKQAKLNSPPYLAEWVPSEGRWNDVRSTGQAWTDVRRKRRELLNATDWVTARAVERGEPVPEEWAVYRQALRDITLQADPFNIIWPTQPA